ncbi:hypothetical protein J7L05_05235 [bacterium]|nr:hypothetical protein [bacterium]
MLNPDSDIRTYGNTYLFDTETAVILNSRHGKFPKGSDIWVRNTVSAVKSAIGRRKTVIASIGMNTWEIALWACGEYGGNVIVILPDNKRYEIVNNVECFMHDYGLKLDNCAFKLVQSEGHSNGKKAWWDARDKLAIDMAYEIMPVSIRKGGRWSEVLISPIVNAKMVNREFQTAYNHKPEKTQMAFEIPQSGISYISNLDCSNLDCDNPDCSISYNPDFITHWTRRFCCPWPGEKSADYYKAIAYSRDKYPRGAGATLKRILSEKLLRGSSTRIKNGKIAVGFTDLPPHEAVKLMRWRKRYCRYTFEPYGIAIRKEAAIDAGIRPVTYIGNPNSPDRIRSSQMTKPDEYTQTCSKGEWWRESEWRFIGNLDLSRFAPADIRVIVPSNNQIRQFSDLSKINAISLEGIGIRLKISI